MNNLYRFFFDGEYFVDVIHRHIIKPINAGLAYIWQSMIGVLRIGFQPMADLLHVSIDDLLVMLALEVVILIILALIIANPFAFIICLAIGLVIYTVGTS